MIPKSMSSTPIGDGNRFSEKIMRPAKIRNGLMRRFWRGFVIFLFGGVLGTAFGVAVGFFCRDVVRAG